MNRRPFAVLLIAWSVLAGCEVLASDWPTRNGRTPEQVLLDVIRHQQRRHVKTSFGELAHECFTDLDFASFKNAGTPTQIVDRLRRAPDFAVVAEMLKAVPAEQRCAILAKARQTARPTWREMGFIDRQGRGQTEAGNQAELMIARAIVDAFATALGDR